VWAPGRGIVESKIVGKRGSEEAGKRRELATRD
jgi:hypothetical protein